jgi:hypothetical protein
MHLHLFPFPPSLPLSLSPHRDQLRQTEGRSLDGRNITRLQPSPQTQWIAACLTAAVVGAILGATQGKGRPGGYSWL